MVGYNEQITCEFEREEIMFKVFCDLDGVLTDFSGRFRELFKIDVAAYETEHGVESIWKPINEHGVNFWANLPWTYDGHRLWRYIKQFNPIIISARPKLTLSKFVEEGKNLWLNKELGKHVPRHIGRRKDKIRQCGFGYVLVDDFAKTVEEWRLRGGVGIVHISAIDTIQRLSQWKKEYKLNRLK